MKDLMDKEAREVEIRSGTKKLICDIAEYRKRIADDDYLESAIQKIAADLSHYLTK
jgi:hypothetical protein